MTVTYPVVEVGEQGLLSVEAVVLVALAGLDCKSSLYQLHVSLWSHNLRSPSKTVLLLQLRVEVVGHTQMSPKL